MKTKHFLTLALLAIFATSCHNADAGYTITGNIQGLPEGAHIELIPVSHEREAAFADTLVVNGKFEFKGNVSEPLAVLLRVKDTYGSGHLMIENKKISIEGQVTSTDVNGTASYDFSNVTINGSPLTDKYIELYSVRDSMDVLHNNIATRYADVSNAMNLAQQAKNQALMDSIAATDEYKAYLAADRDFFSTVQKKYTETIMNNKDTYWGPLMMITLMSYFADEQKEWYEAFSPEAKESYYGKKVFEELYPAGSVGTAVAEFSVKNQDGAEISFTELREGKKYILIDFWASWCNPCIKEIPHLKELYAKYSAQGFEIVSISIDEKEDDWKKKSVEVQLPWPSFLDRSGIATQYKVRVIPTMYLVDEQGILVGENLRGEDLDNKLADLFSKN